MKYHKNIIGSQIVNQYNQNIIGFAFIARPVPILPVSHKLYAVLKNYCTRMQIKLTVSWPFNDTMCKKSASEIN